MPCCAWPTCATGWRPVSWRSTWLPSICRPAVTRPRRLRWACLFPWPAPVLAFLGVEAWRRLWLRRGLPGPLPAMPGMLIGLAAYLLLWRGLPALQ